MSWIRRWFGSGDEEPIRPLAELLAPLQEHARPAVSLVEDPEGACRIGGKPSLPRGTAWPSKDGRPLGFLATLDLSDEAFARIDWLPHTGFLHFFYDLFEQPWGSEPKDAGSWAVLYVMEVGEETASPAPKVSGRIHPHRFATRAVLSFPDEDHPEVEALELTEEESELYLSEGRGMDEDKEGHRVGGYAEAVQSNEMELECQFVTHGLSNGHNDPRAAKLEAGASDWKLLFQLDSADDWMWGDAGMLYFWVRESEARQGQFDGVWMILQCC